MFLSHRRHKSTTNNTWNKLQSLRKPIGLAIGGTNSSDNK